MANCESGSGAEGSLSDESDELSGQSDEMSVSVLFCLFIDWIWFCKIVDEHSHYMS